MDWAGVRVRSWPPSDLAAGFLFGGKPDLPKGATIMKLTRLLRVSAGMAAVCLGLTMLLRYAMPFKGYHWGFAALAVGAAVSYVLLVRWLMPPDVLAEAKPSELRLLARIRRVGVAAASIVTAWAVVVSLVSVAEAHELAPTAHQVQVGTERVLDGYKNGKQIGTKQVLTGYTTVPAYNYVNVPIFEDVVTKKLTGNKKVRIPPLTKLERIAPFRRKIELFNYENRQVCVPRGGCATVRVRVNPKWKWVPAYNYVNVPQFEDVVTKKFVRFEKTRIPPYTKSAPVYDTQPVYEQVPVYKTVPKYETQYRCPADHSLRGGKCLHPTPTTTPTSEGGGTPPTPTPTPTTTTVGTKTTYTKCYTEPTSDLFYLPHGDEHLFLSTKEANDRFIRGQQGIPVDWEQVSSTCYRPYFDNKKGPGSNAVRDAIETTVSALATASKAALNLLCSDPVSYIGGSAIIGGASGGAAAAAGANIARAAIAGSVAAGIVYGTCVGTAGWRADNDNDNSDDEGGTTPTATPTATATPTTTPTAQPTPSATPTPSNQVTLEQVWRARADAAANPNDADKQRKARELAQKYSCQQSNNRYSYC